MSKRILLVEGKDDQHVMWNLFEVREIPEVFQVECPESDRGVDENGGIDKLLDAIPRWLIESDLERLAVVVDADDKGPGARWDAIRERLLKRGYEGIPASLGNDGTVFELSLRPRTPRSVRFGVWIMPDNHSQGMIEDFVAQLIHEDDDMLPHVDRLLKSIPKEHQRFSDAHRPKARIHAWLAIGERPGRPMGQAIKCEEYLDSNHPAVKPFLDWVEATLVN